MQISDHVKQNRKGYPLADMCCFGIVDATFGTFSGACGEAHHHDPGGAHSMNYWYFETPRGRACVRDFHTLPYGLLAIVSSDIGATRWLARYLRHLKFKIQLYPRDDHAPTTEL